MDINITLVGQSLAFALFVWFTWKFVWPPLLKAIEDRQAQIADGLAAAERGHNDLKLAEKRAADLLRDARGQAQEIVAQAQKRAAEISDEAKVEARTEAERIVTAAHADIEQEVNRAREALRTEVASLAVAGAERILEREVDRDAHARMLGELARQL
jgi:F-type H+-transporting ATPase subunit b